MSRRRLDVGFGRFCSLCCGQLLPRLDWLGFLRLLGPTISIRQPLERVCFGSVGPVRVMFRAPDLASLRQNAGPRLIHGLTSAGSTCLGLALILILLLGAARVGFGSVGSAIAYCRGEPVSLEPHLVDVGEASARESRHISVVLTNWTEQPVQLFGGTDDCLCTVLHDLPVTIPGRESRSVLVRVRLPREPGVFTHRAAFYLNHEGFKTIAFRVTGRVSRRPDTG